MMTQFIDAGELFKKKPIITCWTDEHITKILQLFSEKADVSHLAKLSVDYQTIVDNDYNLSVSTYVEAKDTREVIDINALNAEIEETVARISQLRGEIAQIIKEIGSMSEMIFIHRCRWRYTNQSNPRR